MSTRLEQARALVSATRELYSDALVAEARAEDRATAAHLTRVKTENLHRLAQKALAAIEKEQS